MITQDGGQKGQKWERNFRYERTRVCLEIGLKVAEKLCGLGVFCVVGSWGVSPPEESRCPRCAHVHVPF